MYLLGTEMDYKTDKFSSQFSLRTPTKPNVVVVESHLRYNES